MRRTAALAVVALSLVACGDSGGSGSATTMQPGTTETSSLVTAAVSSSTSSSTTTVAEARASAPDFTLALGDGGTFILSEEARPVYLVFWAEW
jgi:hypothetical protein